MANLVSPPKLAAQARDALDAYLDEHPDVRDEAEAAASLAVAEELSGLPQPYQPRNRRSPNRKDTE
jgi:hypothetical protein